MATKTVVTSDISGQPATHSFTWDSDKTVHDPATGRGESTMDACDMTCAELEVIMRRLLQSPSNCRAVEKVIEDMKKRNNG